MMKKPYFINQLLFLILFMVCPIAVSAETEISILYTNNTNGALENCLCPGKAYGSLEKRVLFIREWFEDNPNSLLLDAGDFLSPTRNALKDSIAFRIYEMMAYDAIGLGDHLRRDPEGTADGPKIVSALNRIFVDARLA